MSDRPWPALSRTLVWRVLSANRRRAQVRISLERRFGVPGVLRLDDERAGQRTDAGQARRRGVGAGLEPAQVLVSIR